MHVQEQMAFGSEVKISFAKGDICNKTEDVLKSQTTENRRRLTKGNGGLTVVSPKVNEATVCVICGPLSGNFSGLPPECIEIYSVSRRATVV